MFPSPHRKTGLPLQRQQGSMLIIALFIIIVLGFLAFAMINIGEDSNRSIVYEVNGARALNAANSGAERALADIFAPNVTGSCTTVNNNTYLLPTQLPAFSGCNVTVQCDQFDVVQTGFTHYRIESSANCSAGDFVTQRAVAIEARQRN